MFNNGDADVMSETSFLEIKDELIDADNTFDSTYEGTHYEILKEEQPDVGNSTYNHKKMPQRKSTKNKPSCSSKRLPEKTKEKVKKIQKPKETQYGICPYCGDKYTKSALGLHIRRHTGEKPYKCDMCEKAFVETYDLKRHKRTHTGEKPHVCEVCGKAFSQTNKLGRHKLIHTGERPYKCDLCDKSFTQRNELNLHIRRHTGSKPYACGICGASFLTGTFLRNHQRSMSHFEEEKEDRFVKIRVSSLSRSYRRTGRSELNKSENNGE